MPDAAGGPDRAPLTNRWDVAPAEAVAIQRELAGRVVQSPLDLDRVRLVAGADLSADRMRGDIYVGVVVIDLATGETVDQAVLATTTTFPYVPGLLSFREVPPLLQVWRHLRVAPDVLICDGQGLAHPRRIGLACHAGLALNLPTVGCAKSRYVGTHDEPGADRGSTAPLLDRSEVIGSVVRTRAGVKPVYVSVGHRCTLPDAVELVLRCTTRVRLPEPTRRAHVLVNRCRRGETASCDSN